MTEVKFAIRISSQSGEPTTHKLTCDINNTIGKFRELISTTIPQHPDPHDQKLIFMGQLWKDNQEILKNLLKLVSRIYRRKEYVNIWSEVTYYTYIQFYFVERLP